MGTLNWGDLVADAGTTGDFSALPEGDYDLKIIEASVGESSGGKTMFKIKAEVQTGASKGRLLWDNLVVSPESPAALGFFFRKLAALGLNSDYLRQNPSTDQIAAALLNRSFKGKVVIRKYQGQDKNNIDLYAPASGAGVTFQPAAAAPAAAPAPAPAPAPVAAAPVAPAAPPAPAPESPWAGAAPAAAPPIAAPPF